MHYKQIDYKHFVQQKLSVQKNMGKYIFCIWFNGRNRQFLRCQKFLICYLHIWKSQSLKISEDNETL